MSAIWRWLHELILQPAVKEATCIRTPSHLVLTLTLMLQRKSLLSTMLFIQIVNARVDINCALRMKFCTHLAMQTASAPTLPNLRCEPAFTKASGDVTRVRLCGIPAIFMPTIFIMLNPSLILYETLWLKLH